MLSNLERWVLFFDFCIKPSNDEAPHLPFSQIAPRIVALFERGEATRLYLNGQRAFRISDIALEDGHITLLIQLADKRVADPVFSNLESGDLREESKLEGEGIAVSCHMIIKTEPTGASADRYKAVVESVPGITKSTFEPFINWILNESYANEEFISPISRRKLRLKPVMSVVSHASKTLEDTLAGSRLQGIRLVSTSRVDGMDKNPYTEVTESSIKFKVTKQPGRTSRPRLLSSIRARGHREGYNRIIISYSKDGKQSSVDLSVNEDAATKLFTRQEKVVIPDGIKQCEPSINDYLEDKMVVLLNAE
ncbi:hypothetical protein I4990_00950 [Providencia alcalifaciens]|uniref:hypothetical protein n=1 Tax=Providencia alcalifaciens TaxID=126385 RepID=UPI0018C46DF6|nr:hypothetical protein [Providencia alcalifaciens]MBG5881522.1 hypothetical protein [Providencia alcalifaciens]